MERFAHVERDGSRRSLITVGRLAPEKGLDVLLSAFSRVAGAFPDWTLIVLGEGPERARLSELAERLGISDRVSFAGWIREPGDALARADLFVMSSRYEGFPNALLEAMACGLPAIATESLGAREIITPDIDGVLVPVDSVSELEAALRELMSDDAARRRLSRAARAVSRRFSLEAVVRQWDEILAPAPVRREVCRA
jgi:GalNAc-alpha-(1->4)-GalNAc-alpha-(1->3)-diNAcBac-PP-undecaprenol alpha-1,4-N-acetyl-D-galactosaminyltransferase